MTVIVKPTLVTPTQPPLSLHSFCFLSSTRMTSMQYAQLLLTKIHLPHIRSLLYSTLLIRLFPSMNISVTALFSGQLPISVTTIRASLTLS